MPDVGLTGENQTPRGPWKRVWVLVAVAALALLGVLELSWRHRGYLASIYAWEELWSYHRERVQGTGREMVALLGGSRMQIGFRFEAFREVRPDIELAQLADAGKSPLLALWDLARDTSFRGVVVCSMPEVSTLPGWNGQGALVEWFHQEWSPGEKYSLVLAAPLQAKLVLLQPRLRGPKLLDSLSNGRLPPLNYYRTYFDRSRDMYFDRLPPKAIEGLIQARMIRARQFLPPEPPASMEAWHGHTGRMIRFAERIGSRGGQVVFVNFPVGGVFRRLAE